MLEKKTVTDKLEVVNADTIPMLQVRNATWVEDSGEMIGGKQYARRVIAPTDDISGESAEVQALCAAVHTQDIKDAYTAFLAAQAAEMTPAE